MKKDKLLKSVEHPRNRSLKGLLFRIRVFLFGYPLTKSNIESGQWIEGTATSELLKVDKQKEVKK